MLRYRAAGLEIESELPLPGLCEAPGGRGPADLIVRLGEAPSCQPAPSSPGANWAHAEGELQISAPGLGRFRVREAGEIIVEREAAYAAEDLAPIVSGALVGLFLHLRGRIVLQASAVAVGSGAVLICGETGAGKSTLAAALGQRGYPMICDDLCALDMEALGGPRPFSDATTLKLWADAARRLDITAGPPVRAGLQKRHAPPPAGAAAGAPVRAIYVLQEARPPNLPGIAQPNVVDRAILVRRAAFRPNVVRALGQRGAYFAAAAQIAGAAGVFTFTRALGFERLDAALDELEAHWSQIGLAPGRAA